MPDAGPSHLVSVTMSVQGSDVPGSGVHTDSGPDGSRGSVTPASVPGAGHTPDLITLITLITFITLIKLEKLQGSK